MRYSAGRARTTMPDPATNVSGIGSLKPGFKLLLTELNYSGIGDYLKHDYLADIPAVGTSNRWPTNSSGFAPGLGRNFWMRPMCTSAM